MAKREILAGVADQTIDVFINSSASTTGAGLTGLVFNSAGLTCYYRKGATGTPTALSLATQTVGGAHSDGGFVAVDGTNMPGVYRLDLSDTIVATAGMVTLYLQGATNMVPCVAEIEVVSVNKFDSVRMGMTALPNAAADAAGGLPISDAGGLDLDAKVGALTFTVANKVDANATHISGDSGAADNAEAFFDGTGYAGTNNIIPTVTTVTNLHASAATAAELAKVPKSDSNVTWNATALASINAQADSALADYDGPTYTELRNFVIVMCRKDASVATDMFSVISAINADHGSGAGAFANTTEALEALRDRGDAAWTTATGFSTHSAADVWAVGTRTLTAATNITAGIAAAVWEVATSGLTTAGSIGKLLVDNINATIGSRLASASYTAPDNSGITSAASSAASAASSASTAATNTGTLITNLAALAGKFTGITLLAQWLGAAFGKHTANATALTEINATGAGGGTFAGGAEDSLEANRDNIQAAGAGLTAVQLADAEDVYHADIELTVDGANTQDEYTVTWFKNGVRQTSGITTPLIQVVKRVDGTDLIASTAMTQIGSTGSYKHDATGASRITNGEAVLVLATATINASARTFARLLSRDST